MASTSLGHRVYILFRSGGKCVEAAFSPTPKKTNRTDTERSRGGVKEYFATGRIPYIHIPFSIIGKVRSIFPFQSH
ncbi:hypothetical protein CLV31_11696 [Algoriphagus aquaeductus]|uniref:Uncharacterized protein n=1 Tax=Algoriphagus aquaeductus TaxID=475299 RepID=A0A326RTT4_9BACT|nr:hypothetical protein CLV31_11696 [Algoriphagus aquaeductus]